MNNRTITQTRLRKVGNSNALLFSKELLRQFGVSEDSEVVIEAKRGSITITPVAGTRRKPIPVSEWEAHFKRAKKEGLSFELTQEDKEWLNADLASPLKKNKS